MPAAFRFDLQRVHSAVREHFPWARWAACIETQGLSIDRPRATPHPDYPSILYPIDYGFIPKTVGPDGEPIDVFVGTTNLGLVGALLTADYRQEKRDLKFLYDTSPIEVYTAHGFINYDRTLLEGVLVLRQPMSSLWDRVSS